LRTYHASNAKDKSLSSGSVSALDLAEEVRSFYVGDSSLFEIVSLKPPDNPLRNFKEFINIEEVDVSAKDEFRQPSVAVYSAARSILGKKAQSTAIDKLIHKTIVDMVIVYIKK